MFRLFSFALSPAPPPCVASAPISIGEDSVRGAEHHHLSQKMKMSAFLFDFINKRMEVNHPLCEECTDAILDALDQQLKVRTLNSFFDLPVKPRSVTSVIIDQ